MNIAEQFKNAIASAGMTPPTEIHADGKLRRFASSGKRGDDAGWYVLHNDGIPAGVFGDWRNGVTQSWRAETQRTYTPEQEAAHRARIEAIRKEREQEERQRKEQARQQAEEIWKRSPSAESHPYLTTKGIKANGARWYHGPLVINGMRCEGALVIPMRDVNGTMQSLEFVGPDGAKRFLPSGGYSGCYFGIGKLDQVLCIAEGYATGASVHEATGYAVAVAFTAGNLAPVANSLRQRFPDIKLIICADNDVGAGANTGVDAASKAAELVGAALVVPQLDGEKCDFNDLHRERGAETVKAIIDEVVSKLVEVTPVNIPALTLIRGSEISPEAIRWLWDGFLAQGKLHIMAGAPGAGKTTIALAFAATVTMGGRWPDGKNCKPGNVLIWSGEDDPSDTLMPRLMAMGADRDRVYFVGSVRVDGKPVTFDPSKHMREMQEAAAAIGDIRLMIVDPIVNAVSGDSHKSTEVRRSLQPVVDMAAKLDAAAIDISHFSKGTSGRDPVERITGSVAFGALPRIVFAAAKNQDGGRMLVRTKSNIGPDGGGFAYDLEQAELKTVPGLFASRVLWGEPLEGEAKELLAVAEVDNSTEERAIAGEASEWLKETLEEEGGALDVKTIMKLAKESGFSERTIYRARVSLRCRIETKGFGRDKRSSWALTHEAVKSPETSNLVNSANLANSQSVGKHGKNGG